MIKFIPLFLWELKTNTFLLQLDRFPVISESKSDLFFELIGFEEEEDTKCPL